VSLPSPEHLARSTPVVSYLLFSTRVNVNRQLKQQQFYNFFINIVILTSHVGDWNRFKETYLRQTQYILLRSVLVHQMHCNLCFLHDINSTLIVDVLICSAILMPRRCLPWNLASMSIIHNSLPNVGLTLYVRCVSVVMKFHFCRLSIQIYIFPNV
jgi:hypothetical protein